MKSKEPEQGLDTRKNMWQISVSLIRSRKPFSELSATAKEAMRNGDFKMFADSHKDMAVILGNEEKYRDEIKSRILAFYFDMSGGSRPRCIDRENTEKLSEAILNAEISEQELADIYFDVIRADTSPNHPMTVKGSYKLLLLCIDNQWNKVCKIIGNLK